MFDFPAEPPSGHEFVPNVDVDVAVRAGGPWRVCTPTGAGAILPVVDVWAVHEGLRAQELGVLLAAALERVGTFWQAPDARAEAIDSAELEFDDLDERFYEIEATAGLDQVMARLV